MYLSRACSFSSELTITTHTSMGIFNPPRISGDLLCFSDTNRTVTMGFINQVKRDFHFIRDRTLCPDWALMQVSRRQSCTDRMNCCAPGVHQEVLVVSESTHFGIRGILKTTQTSKREIGHGDYSCTTLELRVRETDHVWGAKSKHEYY